MYLRYVEELESDFERRKMANYTDEEIRNMGKREHGKSQEEKKLEPDNRLSYYRN